MAQVIVTETLELKRIEVDNTEPVTSVTVTDATDYDRVAVTSTGDQVTVVLSATSAGVNSVNGYTGAVTLTTTNINEGTNLYYTSNRANTDFDSRLATKSTTDVAEGANLYYTTARANSDFDTRLATKSTTNITEGSNLYYTTARANTDFDTRLATKTADNLTQGTTNKYFSNTLARSAISVSGSLSYNSTTGIISYTTPTTIASLINHTTSNLTEGSNLYYTNSRARAAISVSGSLSYSPSTGVISYTTPSTIASLSNHNTNDLVEGSTNKYFTENRVIATLVANNYATQSYVSTAVSTAVNNLIDSAPGTLDTLNELAAALGDDPNYATTITTALGTKLNTADFNTTFDTQLATKTTSNLAEGTNLYYTTARANSAFDTRIAAKTTDDLAQGTSNLYYNDTYVASYLMNANYPTALLGQTNIANGALTVETSAGAVYLNVPVVQIGDGSTGGEQGLQFTNSVGNLAIVSINAAGQLVWTSKPDADYSERFELPLHRRINYTATGTSAQTIDSFARTDYRAAKYLITAYYGGEFSVCEMLVLNKITAADHVIYAEINSSSALATYNAVLSGTNIVLQATPANNGTVFKFTRHMVEA